MKKLYIMTACLLMLLALLSAVPALAVGAEGADPPANAENALLYGRVSQIAEDENGITVAYQIRFDAGSPVPMAYLQIALTGDASPVEVKNGGLFDSFMPGSKNLIFYDQEHDVIPTVGNETVATLVYHFPTGTEGTFQIQGQRIEAFDYAENTIDVLSDLAPIVLKAPSEDPIETPTEAPTEVPSEAPSEDPTEAPSEDPTEAPSEAPSEDPSEAPSEAPSEDPTEVPSEVPSEAPSEAPDSTEAAHSLPTEIRITGCTATMGLSSLLLLSAVGVFLLRKRVKEGSEA